jgi:hypothetical protein
MTEFTWTVASPGFPEERVLATDAGSARDAYASKHLKNGFSGVVYVTGPKGDKWAYAHPEYAKRISEAP